MILAYNRMKDIPKEWEHKPELKNNKGNTVAMLMAYKRIIPPE